MRRRPNAWCAAGPPRRRATGFTLIETIFVIVLLGMAAAAVLAMQPKILQTQNTGRDELVGQELVRACAERILAVRRHRGYTNVDNTLCDGMGGVGGFASNPTITMVDDAASAVTSCSSSACRITVVFAKTSGVAAYVVPVTLQLSYY